MKICFFYEGLRPGGVEHMIANLSRELIRRGHSLTLFLAGSPTAKDHVPDPACEIIWLNHPKLSAHAAIGPLIRHLRSRDYDILMSAMPQFNNAAIIARHLSGKPVRNVLTERTNPFADYAMEPSLKRRAWRKASAALYPFATRIVAVSGGLADSLCRFTGLKREKVTVIYNPAYRGNVYSDAQIAERAHPWTLDGGAPVVTAAGRMFPQKDFPTFIRAIARVRETRDVRAVILGDGPLRGELEALVDSLGLKDAVAMPGFADDINPTLQAAGYFVLSSGWEGFGNVLVEALGCGCGIVSTDCPDGPAEILSGGAFGRLTPVGDIDAMAAAIIAMIDEPVDREAQKRRASEFSVPVAADQYEAVFEQAMQARA